MRAMIDARPTLLRLDADAAMRDNSWKAVGGSASGALAKEKTAAGGADVVDAKEVSAQRRRPRGRACGQGSNRELAYPAAADHHSDRARRQPGHGVAHARQQADRTFRSTR